MLKLDAKTRMKIAGF